MAHELDAPAPVVASSGPSRRAITIAAVIFAVLAATALTWAKCWPYASKTAHVLTNAFGGISILTEGGRTPRPRHRGTRHGPSPSPTSAPSGSHWSPRSSSLSQLRRSYRGAGWYASAPLARRIGRWRPARAAINDVHPLHRAADCDAAPGTGLDSHPHPAPGQSGTHLRNRCCEVCPSRASFKHHSSQAGAHRRRRRARGPAGEAVTDDQAGKPPEAATAALDDLITELTVCIDGLQRALRRAEQLRAQRHAGHPWLLIVSAET